MDNFFLVASYVSYMHCQQARQLPQCRALSPPVHRPHAPSAASTKRTAKPVAVSGVAHGSRNVEHPATESSITLGPRAPKHVKVSSLTCN